MTLREKVADEMAKAGLTSDKWFQSGGIVDRILSLVERECVERERKAYMQAVADVAAEYKGRVELSISERAATRRYPLPKEGT